jgi:co-chaperonin GroES (HSP10)
MPAALMQHDIDPATDIFNKIGDLSKFKVMFGKVLVATYMRPEKTKSGIILSDKTRDEDEWQGKASLVLKMGPLAFKDTPDVKFYGERVEVGDWIAVRPSDAQAIKINGVPCRVIQDVHCFMKLPSPDVAW